jgi:hypothetical protein
MEETMTRDDTAAAVKASFFQRSGFGIIALLVALLAGIGNISRVLATGDTSLHINQFLVGNTVVWYTYTVSIVCSPPVFGLVALLVDKNKLLAILALVMSFINWIIFGVLSVTVCATLNYCGGG